MSELPVIVLVNLGTPQTPTTADVRTYLREFLTDQRVIETHPWLWRPILEAFILPRRPKQSAEKYASVWLENGSPLMVYSLAQRDALRQAFEGVARVELAMRYGQPAMSQVLDQIHADGHRKILIVPLYPQYSACSAGTVLDEAYRWALSQRDHVELRTIRSFGTDAKYIDAIVSAITNAWSTTGRPNFENGDKLALSFHSIPQAMHDQGDPYHYECTETAELIAQRLGVPVVEHNDQAGGLVVTYQSVFGPAQWLKPATIDSITAWGSQGVKRVDVICPGFVSDCLETLEEINMLNRDAYQDAGGEQFHYIPWGNDLPQWTNALSAIVEKHVWHVVPQR